MKASLRIFLRSAVLLFLFFAAEGLRAQQYFYVVIASYTEESHAEKYMGYVRSKQFDAQKMLSENKKLYYVYTLKTTKREDAILQTKRLQQQSEFKDTWLYSGTQGTVASEDTGKKDAEQLKQPLVTEDPTPVIVPLPVPDSITTEIPTQPEVTESELKVKGKLFKFTVQTQEGEAIPLGEVHDVDYKRGRDLATFRSDKYIDVVKPSAKGQLTLVCGIFGYKEVVKKVDYNNPSLVDGASQDERGAWTIPFTLERMKKGDASVMYHVSFYKDAVIMLPPSQLELDELVNMMKMNPNYIIKIHGHANGNNKRKIIDLGKTKNYFTVTGSRQHEGSAKELSKLRAEAVQKYLADNGIDPKRSTIFAWGGMNMLVSEHSTSAKLNDRIEIEIMKD